MSSLLLLGVAHSQVLPSGERLKDLAPPDFAIGGVLSGYNGVYDFTEYMETARREFSGITVSAYMAYGPWPDRNQPVNTSGLVQMTDWATGNKQFVHGHVLVYPFTHHHLPWYKALPLSQVNKH